MTHARDKVYQAVNRQVLLHERIEPGSGSDLDLDFSDLLDQVEDDRAHREAERLRQRAEASRLDLLNPFSPYQHQLIRILADLVDPYEERDGQLVRKSDGKPVAT